MRFENGVPIIEQYVRLSCQIVGMRLEVSSAAVDENMGDARGGRGLSRFGFENERLIVNLECVAKLTICVHREPTWAGTRTVENDATLQITIRGGCW